MERIEVNVITGEQHRVQLTPEEIAALQVNQQPVPAPLTPAQKLANASLTVDELKQLLGLAPEPVAAADAAEPAAAMPQKADG